MKRARIRLFPALFALSGLIACTQQRAAAPTTPHDLELAAFTATPIPAFSVGETYQGLEGGLYGGGSNTPSAAHDAAGVASGDSVQPINGKIVVLCLGFSSVQRECSRFQAEESGLVPDSRNKVQLPPDTWSVEVRGGIVIVNGAQSYADIEKWSSPARVQTYEVVRDERLPPYTEADVQVVWMQLNARVGTDTPSPTLPSPDAHAWGLRDECPNVLAVLRTRYPNLRQVFISAKQYTGYSTSGDNAEPYSYEGGFGMRACILDYEGPLFLGWGPYLWDPTWVPEDYASDGVHPSGSGQAKVAALLRAFLGTSPYTRWWDRLLAQALCGNGVDDDGDGKIDFPADPGCTSAGDGTESPDPPPPPPPPPPPSAITLTATGTASGARRYVNLQWSGASGTKVELWRNGSRRDRITNDGQHTDRPPDGAKGTFRYKICESGGTVCSPERSVTF